MVEVSVAGEFDVPAERLWALVADFGDVAWIPGMGEVRVEGEGPGMIRFMPGGEKEIHEQLESVDGDARRLVYTIPRNVPFAVTGYRATMQVEDAPSGSRLVWSCTCEADGISDAEAEATVKGLYDMMLGWIGDHLKRG